MPIVSPQKQNNKRIGPTLHFDETNLHSSSLDSGCSIILEGSGDPGFLSLGKILSNENLSRAVHFSLYVCVCLGMHVSV